MSCSSTVGVSGWLCGWRETGSRIHERVLRFSAAK
jgi:hypothetical protein